MAEPGFSSSRSPCCSTSGRCEWPNTTAWQSGNRAAQPAGRARRPARSRAPSRSARRPASTTRSTGSRADEVVVVAVAEHGLDGAEAARARRAPTAPTKSPACRIRSAARALLDQPRRQLPPAAGQVRVRHDGDAHQLPSDGRGRRRRGAIAGRQRGDVVQPQHRRAGAAREHGRGDGRRQVVLVGAGRVGRELLVRARPPAPGSRARSRGARSRSRIRSRRVDLPNPKPGSTRIASSPTPAPRRRAPTCALELAQHLVDGALVGAGRVRARPPAVVRDHEPGAGVGDHAGELGVEAAGVVVHEGRRRPRAPPSATGARYVSTETQASASGSITGADARDLVRDRDLVAHLAGLAADVEHVGALGEQRASVRGRRLRARSAGRRRRTSRACC